MIYITVRLDNLVKPEDGTNDYILSRLYHDQLLLSGQHLDSLLEDTTSNLELLSSLSVSFKAVEVQTSTFQSCCDGLLSEQRHLETLEHKLVENLHYYDYLDRVTRRLNAPGAGNSVRRDDFSEMLSNLDNCLEYMQTHVGFIAIDQTLADRLRPLIERQTPTSHDIGY